MEQPEKTLKELQAELVSLGMPEEETKTFNTKAQIVAVLHTLKAKDAVEKVKTLEEVESPAEKKAFEAKWLSKAMLMKRRLESQPLVRTLLPLEGSEKQGVVEWRTDKKGEKYQYVVSGAYETVQLNGYKYIIPKGVYCDVPEQIAEVLANAYHQTQAAGADISLDRIDDRTGKPMRDVI
jgi:hypothetical protein